VSGPNWRRLMLKAERMKIEDSKITRQVGWEKKNFGSASLEAKLFHETNIACQEYVAPTF
jgi:hypothetical protein